LNKFDIYLNPFGLNKVFNIETNDTEFSAEISKLSDTDNILYDTYAYPSHGVELDVLDNDNVKLLYNGVLTKNDSKDIFAVLNYGNINDLKEGKFIPMNATNTNMYELIIQATDSKCLNLSFRDGKDNYDDNSGRGYVFCSHHLRRIST